jgi:hypothetical protein
MHRALGTPLNPAIGLLRAFDHLQCRTSWRCCRASILRAFIYKTYHSMANMGMKDLAGIEIQPESKLLRQSCPDNSKWFGHFYNKC